MRGDFTRLTFDPKKHYTGVLLQQGRVHVDADWNELVETLDYRVLSELADVLATGAPADGFSIRVSAGGELELSPGRLYVDGLVCELEEPARPVAELLGRPPDGARTSGLVFLEAWGRHVTAVEDPDLVDPALGVDTATRLQTGWRLGLVEGVLDCAGAGQALRVEQPGALTTTAPGGYTGLENRLYRVEVHDSGHCGKATFKWSRENASVAYRVLGVEPGRGEQVVLAPGSEQPTRLRPGDAVEIESVELELSGRPGLLAGVEVTEQEVVTLDRDVSGAIVGSKAAIRRWSGPPSPQPAGETWTELEDGISIRFHPGQLQTGDYWVFPARTATGRIEELDAAPPRGPRRRTAPLAIVSWEGAPDSPPRVQDCRKSFRPLPEAWAELAKLVERVARLEAQVDDQARQLERLRPGDTLD